VKISEIKADCYRIALPQVLSNSRHGLMPDFQLITVRIVDNEGAEGLGYTYTIGQGGVAIRAMIARDLSPALVGEDPRLIERLWERMWWRLHWVGRGGAASFAIAAVDVALWDLRARRLGEPLWRLLGGHDPEVEVYAGGIDLDFPLERLEQQTRDFLADGVKAIKMKVGRQSLAEDVERVGAIRELIGPNVALMVDANMGWRVDQAIAAARALRGYDLLWLEEPTIPDDVAGHARIAEQGGISIAAGENLHSVYEFQHYLAGRAVAFPQPDVANVGGITAWLKVAKLAEINNLPVTTHGVHDLHVHLLAAVPNASYLEIHGFGLERFMRSPLSFQDGRTRAPDRPGHGVELAWEALEEFWESP
jgi:L-alanine-DL-glutamate epimerase-like enolase superfamily enzyme